MNGESTSDFSAQPPKESRETLEETMLHVCSPSRLKGNRFEVEKQIEGFQHFEM